MREEHIDARRPLRQPYLVREIRRRIRGLAEGGGIYRHQAADASLYALWQEMRVPGDAEEKRQRRPPAIAAMRSSRRRTSATTTTAAASPSIAPRERAKYAASPMIAAAPPASQRVRHLLANTSRQSASGSARFRKAP